MTLIKYYPEEDKTYAGFYNAMGRFVRDKGYYFNTHAKTACAGEWCAIHNPSPHPLWLAPLNWRGDRGIMERMCIHGVGHNDPDDTEFRKTHNLVDSGGVHGCDGCCIRSTNAV